MDGPPANDWCSICHNNFDVPCQANCSHWFCGNCILQVWNHGSTFQPCLCPLCRRQITLLVPTESSSQQRHDPEVSEILGKVQTYNRMFGQRSDGLIQRMQDLPFLLRRLLREMMDPQRSLPLVIRARVYLAVKLIKEIYKHTCMSLKCIPVFFNVMIVSAIYIVSPIDIIPEGVLGVIGLLDDFIIALICFLHVAALYRSVLVFRHGGS